MAQLVGARRERFHQVGPWALVITAIVVAIGIEAYRRHVVTSFEALYFAVLIPSIILHEVSHGFVAYLCGDDTAKNAGRLSLNPLRHIDPVGTVLVPLLLIVTFGTAFGWARPVPISVNRLRHPRNQAVLVGLAGPAVNIILAALGGLALYLATHGGATLRFDTSLPFGDELLFVFGEANVVIAVFNLIPIPPLDGSALLERLLPAAMLPGYYSIRQYAMFAVLALVLFDQSLLGSLFNRAFSIWQHICLPAL